MATQGMVTVRKHGQVIMKIVTGSDGYHAERVAKAIRTVVEATGRLLTREQAYTLARRLSFGDETSLVVINRNGITFRGGEDVSPLYRDTFDNPEFNPRWEHGTTDHLEIVDLPAKRRRK